MFSILDANDWSFAVGYVEARKSHLTREYLIELNAVLKAHQIMLQKFSNNAYYTHIIGEGEYKFRPNMNIELISPIE